MALSTAAPLFCRTSHNSLQCVRPTSSATPFSQLFHGHSEPKSFCFSSSTLGTHNAAVAYSGDTGSVENKIMASGLLDENLLRRILEAKEAHQVLKIIAEAKMDAIGCSVENDDCRAIISAAFDENNVQLALSVFHAMRSRRVRDMNEVTPLQKWRWARPDVQTYALLVRGLSASLRVSEAIRIIELVSGAEVDSGNEVPFGVIVRCPICMLAVAVAQPQHGIQVPDCATEEQLLVFQHDYFHVASCSKCRYQYQIVSGDTQSIDSEMASMDTSAWEKALRFLQLKRDSMPAAIHSIVVRTPSGIACTYKIATKTVELPAQEGERVSIVLAAPANMYQEIGPLKLSAKPSELRPGEPMSLTNHATGQVSQLLRAPGTYGKSILLNPALLFSSIALLATGDAASGLVDPSFPRLISVVAVASLAVGSTMNLIILPQLSKLPQRAVDLAAIKQQLLSQYDVLKSRIKDLRQAAEKEAWMLARMCQLENKMVAVGEPSYCARRARVKKVRESLEKSISARIELINSYAKISSMIEIEVELESDVVAAEAINNAESIAEQIQQTMEIENLEERWFVQAEANDEVERLLNDQGASTKEA